MISNININPQILSQQIKAIIFIHHKISKRQWESIQKTHEALYQSKFWNCR